MSSKKKEAAAELSADAIPRSSLPIPDRHGPHWVSAENELPRVEKASRTRFSRERSSASSAGCSASRPEASLLRN
jgi:hypothetical protein